jgi:hypothetical protein
LEALERRCREPYERLIIERLNQLAPTWLYQMLSLLDPEEIAMLQPKASYSYTCMLREGADFLETLIESCLLLLLDNA